MDRLRWRVSAAAVLAATAAACSVPEPHLVDGALVDGLAATDASVDGAPRTAHLTLAPDHDLAFGDVVVGASSSKLQLTVSNDGTGASAALAITTDSPAFVVSDDTCAHVELAAQSTCTFAIAFAPDAPGATTGSVHVVAGSTTLARALTGSGLAPGLVQLVDASYDFGDLAVDAAPARHVFVVRNGGGVMIGAPVPTIGGASGYYVDASTCVDALAPGATCTITARFDPDTVGDKPGSLTVTSANGGGQDAVALAGRAIATIDVRRAGTGTGVVRSTQPGLDCGTTCRGDFASSPVTLTATADVGSTFAGWSGDCTDAGSCALQLTGAKTVTATFVRITPALTVTKLGLGTGNVTSSPLGIACGATCTHAFDFDTVVMLTAAPTANSTFAGWGGACAAATGATCSVAMSQTRDVIATFDAVTPTLTIARTGAGSGTVTSPSGIDCGTTCSQAYQYGTPVDLVATPAAGSRFAGWSGDAGTCTASPTCSVAMDRARSITATFEVVTPTLTVSRVGSGTVTASLGAINCGTTCSDTLEYGRMVRLTATPAAGALFSAWSGDCTGSTTTCDLVMTADRVVTATFVPFTPALVVAQAGSGTGTVTRSPAGTSCGPACATYPFNTDVTLVATPSATSTFTGWSGDGCTGTAATCTVKMSVARTVTATFDLKTPTLAVSLAGTGTGSVLSMPAGIACPSGACTTTFSINSAVVLTATADVGSTFVGWTGACTGVGPCTVTMDAGRGVTATFAAITPTLAVTKAGTGASSGTVTSTPSGIACGASCASTFTFGQDVTLTATATGGAAFVGWSGSGAGACSGSGTSTCVVKMDQARDVTATFNAGLQPLAVSLAGAGTGTVTATGLACPGTCTNSYTYGAMPTLTASAAAGSTFTGWSGTGAGACAGSSTPTCAVTMDRARDVTATFALGPQTLVVATAGTGQGVVTSTSPAGISCGNGSTACSLTVPAGSTIALSASPANGGTFTGWSGDCTGTGTCTVAMSAARTVTAGFAAGPQLLAVSLAGTGASSGTVTSSPSGIACGSSCSASFGYNSAVTLAASSTGTTTFAGWSGDACSGSTSPTCTTTMDRARAVTATFVAGAQTLTVTYAGTGTGTIASSPTGLSCTGSCSKAFAYDTVVDLAATPTNGSTFVGWSGAGCTGTTCSVRMDQARAVTATFVAGPQTLTIVKAGTGAGTVTSDGNVINCGATCAASFAYDTPVTLTAAPTGSDTFTGWTGGCTGSTATCTVTMRTATTVTATFAAGLRAITVATTPALGGGAVTATPASVGIASCGATGGTCTGSAAYNSMVTLTATPAPGYAFGSWGGDCSGTTATCTVTMSAARSVTATFAQVTYGLTVAPPSNGAVASSDGAIACGATCSHTYTAGTMVTLTAMPAPGYAFGSWGGDCSGTTGTCTVTMSAARSVTATFAQVTYALTVAPPSNGSVASSDGAIACGATCSHTYTAGTMVTLTAMPAPGYAFGAWGGDCSGTAATCTVTMSAARAVTATFAQMTYGLTVAPPSNGSVASSDGAIACGATCSHTYTAGTMVTLTAMPAPGYAFGAWGGDCSGTTGTCIVTMSAARSVTATFAQVTYGLTVAPPSNGSVASSDGAIACGATCSHTYTAGTMVTLTAMPAPGYAFGSWGGDCSGTTGTCTVTMSAARSVTATFTQVTYALTVAPPSNGAVASSDGAIACGATCSHTYTAGTMVTLTAMPAPGYAFGSWGGSCSGTAATCTVTMSAARSVTATFAPVTYALAVAETGSGKANGKITSSVGGIACTNNAGTCTTSVTSGTSVTLTAAATSAGAYFVGWSGACSGTATTCTVSMTQARSATAQFNSYFTLNVTTDFGSLLRVKYVSSGGTLAPGAVQLNSTAGGTTSFAEGSTVTITATWTNQAQCTISNFTWTGCATTASCGTTCRQCTVTLNANTSVMGNYSDMGTGCSM